jgi:nitric oxide dioxygenase
MQSRLQFDTPSQQANAAAMDERPTTLVQQSFARAALIGPHVAATFYAELFAIDPSLRAMFPRDMIIQGHKLMSMLANLVAGLNEPETITPTLETLARSHVAYGVKAQHYAMVGTALMRTLRHELGGAFTPEVQAAWVSAYQFLSQSMIEAAYGEPTPPAG